MPDIRNKIFQYAKGFADNPNINRRRVVSQEQPVMWRRRGRGPRIWSYGTKPNKGGGGVFVCTILRDTLSQNNDWNLNDNNSSNDSIFTSQNMKKARRDCNIGFGECYDLAYCALEANGGLPPVNIKRTHNDIGPRRWSGKLANFSEPNPKGIILEIVQGFSSFSITFKKSGNQISWYGGWPDINTFEGAHTAVVISTSTTTGKAKVYQQNGGTPHKNYVHIDEIQLRNAIITKGDEITINVCADKRASLKNFLDTHKAIENGLTSTNFLGRRAKMNLLVKRMKNYVSGNNQFSAYKFYIPHSPYQ